MRFLQTIAFFFVATACFGNESSSPQLHQSVHVVTGKYCEMHTDLQLPGETSLELQRLFSSEEGWLFNLPWNSRDHDDSDKINPHVFEYDSQKRLTAIKSRSTEAARPLLRVSYPDPKTWMMETQDGRSLTYCMKGLHPYAIASITTPDNGVLRYEYRDHPNTQLPLVTRKEDAEGGYLITEYYDGKQNQVGQDLVTIAYPKSDFRIGRVKLQKAPLGQDATPVIKNRFFYETGVTKVFDALNHKTAYRYDDKQKVTHREHYLSDENGKNTLYRTEQFFWETFREQPFIVAQALLDGQGNPYLCRTFTRDKTGRVLKESLYGELTGKSTIPLKLKSNGFPVENGVEHWDISFSYEKDSPYRLISKTNGHGTVIQYRYHGKTNRIAAKLLMDQGKICTRHFYRYNDAGQLLEQIIDDGNSDQVGSFSGVTERRTISSSQGYSDSSRDPFMVQEERYFDSESQREYVAKSTRQSADACGRVLRIDSFDAQGRLCASKEEGYDAMGRLLYRRDDCGNETKTTYDRCGNPVTVVTTTAEGVCCQNNLYDFSHRLIRKEETLADGTFQSVGYCYDLMGNCITSVDASGNETHYRYDALGRLVETVYPQVLDADGALVHPVERREYDLLNRVTSIVDAKGQVTTTRYNICGKPLEKRYPDGTRELFEYAIDGVTQVRGVSREGLITKHRHDALLRVITTERYDAAHHLMGRATYSYNAFHLISQTDFDGTQTTFTYDGAGRILSCCKQNGIDRKKIAYAYDGQGNEIQRKEWFGKNEEEFACYTTVRDPHGKVLEVRTEDASSNVLKVEYPPEKTTSHLIRDFHYCNERGQHVLQTSLIDSSGRQLITTHDAMNRPESIIRKNALGQVLTKQEMRYDLAGSKVSESHTVFQDDHVLRTYTMQWKYGPGGRLESVIEAAGTPQQTVTSSIYNALGQLAELIKPDGVRLFYTYDAAGRLLRLASSDSTVAYRYSYDEQGRISSIADELHGGVSESAYGPFGEVVHEGMVNGLSLSRQYDAKGRVTELGLPDQSKIVYGYDAAFLRTVTKYSSDNSPLYTQSYTAYDLSGKLLKTSMIGDLGEIAYRWNASDQLVGVQTPFGTSQNEMDASGAVVQNRAFSEKEECSTQYRYDDLQQLVSEAGNSGEITYSYDSIGNRLSKNEVSYTTDGGNRIVAAGDALYQYDRNGCLLEKSSPDGIEIYAYDALNRLIRFDSAACSVEFTYDAWHRKQTKTISQHDSGAVSRLNFLYDGDNEIGLVDETGQCVELRTLGAAQGAERGATVAIELSGIVYAPIHDIQGSISLLIDVKSREVAESYCYSAFGETEIIDSTGSPVERSIVGNPWRYCGKRYDDHLCKSDFGKRFYDPELGRWMTPDPLGTMDGINRYAYVKNNPLGLHDLYGLYSLGSIWGGMTDAMGSLYTSLSEAMSKVVGYLQQQSFNSYIEKDAEQIGLQLFGSAFLTTTGYYDEEMERGVFGDKELDDNIRVTAIHGMLNSHSACIQTMEMLSQFHGGMNVHYVFYPTQGWGRDLLQLVLTKFGYVPPQAKLLAETWRQLIAEMGGVDNGGTIVHYAHSLGGTITLAARDLLTPEEQKMIKVIAIGSTSVIPNNAFGSVIHYVSYRDGVFFADPFGYLRSLVSCHGHVNWVGSSSGIPLIDHLLTMDTYQQLIATLGRDFLATYWREPL